MTDSPANQKTKAWSNLKALLREDPSILKNLAVNQDILLEILEENNRLFNAMVDAFEGMIYICSTDYRIEFLNERMIEHLGYDATGEHCYKAFGRRAVCPWCINQRILRGETVRWEMVSPKDGHWYYVVNAPIKHVDGSVSKYAMMMDIHDRKTNEKELDTHRAHLEALVKARTAELTFTNAQLRLEIEERKEAEAALRRSEAKYRELVQNANSLIIRFDTQGRLTFFNEFAQQFFGYSESEILGRRITDTILPSRDSMGRDVASELDDFFNHPDKFKTNELENTRKNGERCWIAWTNRPIHDAQGNVVEFLCVGLDISERKQARRQIQTLTHELLKAQENERAKIARDLHDHIAQDLSSLKIGLQTLFDDGREIGNQRLSKVNALVNILQRSISEVRNLAYDLRPPGLDQLGLVSTLFLYCEEFAKSNNLKIDFSAAGLDDLYLDEDTQINIYRLIQESLNNVKKHADAHTVTVRLVASSPNIMLRIKDDGKGFDVKRWRAKSNSEKRMGLSSMVERVGLLNGLIDIRSRPEKGTAIFITIPIKEQYRDKKDAHSYHR